MDRTSTPTRRDARLLMMLSREERKRLEKVAKRTDRSLSFTARRLMLAGLLKEARAHREKVDDLS